MDSFIVLATIVSVIVVGLLVWSSLKQQGAHTRKDAREQCYRVHQQTLEELKADHAAQRIDEPTYRDARVEAEARLVEEIRSINERPLVNPSFRWIVPLAFALPLAAAGLYLLVGNLKGTDPEANFIRTGNAGALIDAVTQLEKKVKENPEDYAKQLMLARSYRVMGRYADAVAAFGKSWPLIKDNPTEIAIFAGVLAIHRGEFTGKPDELIAQALAIEPNNNDALVLAGGSAFKRENYTEALRHWNKLKSLLQDGSEEHQWVTEQIAKAEEKIKNPGAQAPSSPGSGAPSTPAGATLPPGGMHRPSIRGGLMRRSPPRHSAVLRRLPNRRRLVGRRRVAHSRIRTGRRRCRCGRRHGRIGRRVVCPEGGARRRVDSFQECGIDHHRVSIVRKARASRRTPSPSDRDKHAPESRPRRAH